MVGVVLAIGGYIELGLLSGQGLTDDKSAAYLMHMTSFVFPVFILIAIKWVFGRYE